jgi:hypothetical protein
MAKSTTGTAANAAEIAEKLEAARNLASKANQALKEAVKLIEAGEKDVEMKTPGIKAASGALTLVQGTLSNESSNWSLYASARNSRS